MKITWKTAVIVGVAAVGIAALAAGPFTNPRVSKALNLTPEQQQKMENLQYQHQKDMIKFREEVSLKRLDFQREMEKDSPDRTTVDRLADEMGALRVRMSRAKVDHLLDVRKVLTPEQWSKARELMQARRAQRMAGRGGRLGPGARGDMGPGAGLGQGPGAGPGRGQGRGPGQGPGPGGPKGGADGDDLLAPGL